MSDVILKMLDLHKHFGNHEVLKGIDLNVRRGEVLVIIGPSGSGKSTLLRCLNFLEEYDKGEVLFDGRLVGYRRTKRGKLVKNSARNIAAVRKRMGMVFQSFNLFPHMTVLENVVEGPIVVQRIGRKEAERDAKALLERVGLGDKFMVSKQTFGGSAATRRDCARPRPKTGSDAVR